MHQRSLSSCNFGGLSSRDLATRGISHKARSLAVALTSLCSLTHSTCSRLAHSAHSRSRLPHRWSVHSLERSPHLIRSPHLTSPYLTAGLFTHAPLTSLTSPPNSPHLIADRTEAPLTSDQLRATEAASHLRPCRYLAPAHFTPPLRHSPLA
jgi:hypothetical protein